MPTFVKAHGTVTAIFALLYSLSASTKLSVISHSGSAAVNATRRFIASSSTNTNISIALRTANQKLANKMDGHRSSRFFFDTVSEQQPPNYHYTWRPQQQPHNLWPNHNNPETSTTFVYPLLTTPHPLQRQYKTAFQPTVTKLYVKPIRRTVNFFDLEDESEDQLPFSDWYSNSGIFSWFSPSPSLPTIRLTPDTYSQPSDSYDVSDSDSDSDASVSNIERHRLTVGYRAPIMYHHHHEDDQPFKLDLKHLGILALVKLGLTNLKVFGVLKLLFIILLKFKLLLLILFYKLSLILKAIKHLKTLLIPLYVLFGLLLLPLILLPLLVPLLLLRLLPLLLLLPIPVPAKLRENKNGNKLMEYLKSQRSDPIIDIMVQLIESETCVERICCQLATRNESRLLYPIVKWHLNQMKKILKHGRVITYVEAYLDSSEAFENSENWKTIDSRQWCQQRYSCINLEAVSEDASNNEDNSNKISTTESANHTLINRVSKK